MKALFHSLRWRLQAWHGLLLLLVIVASILPSYHLVWENQLQRIDQELQEKEHLLMMSVIKAITPAPSTTATAVPLFLSPEALLQRLQALPASVTTSLAEDFSQQVASTFYFSLRDHQDRILLQSREVPADMQFLPVGPGEFNEGRRSVGSRRECSRTASIGLKVTVGRDITPETMAMRRLATTHAGLGLGVWLLGLMGGWWLSGRAIRPIQTISQTASRIAAGNLRERIDVTAMDLELSQLSQVLNATFEQLHVVFERQRQFTADASHELRTPISILMAETQRLLKRERTTAEYREALQTCGETAQRMRRLVEALLILARQERPGMTEHHQPVDLSTLVSDILPQHQAQADGHGRRLESVMQSAPCRGDAAALTMLIANLISNALEYGGNTVVTCRVEGNESVLTVQDDGPGIAEVDRPHLFERFYRADQARQGSADHSGLGLSIAQAIAEDHGGTLRLLPTARGTCFELRVPSLKEGSVV